MEKEKEKLEADGDPDENGKSRIGKYIFISGLFALGGFFIIMVRNIFHSFSAKKSTKAKKMSKKCKIPKKEKKFKN